MNIKYNGKTINVKILPYKRKGQNSYSFYCRVTYDRKSTKFPTNVIMSINTLEKANKEVERNVHLHDFREWICDIVKFEIEFYNEKYTIIGLSERISFYRKSLYYTISQRLKTDLMKCLENSLTYRQYMDYESASNFVGNEEVYLTVFKHLHHLHKKYELNLKNVISIELVEDITALAVLVTYQSYRNQQFLKTGNMRENDHIIIGHWLTNHGSIKDRFRKYIKEEFTYNWLNHLSERYLTEIRIMFNLPKFDNNMAVPIINKRCTDLLKIQNSIG